MPDPIHIACIVEGHGEVEAVPVLLRRLAGLIVPSVEVRTPTPIRIHRDKLLKPGELERAVALAAAKLGRKGGIFVLIDADEDCPAHLGPELRARAARDDVLLGLVVAKPEFESWFLAAAESLRGHRGLEPDITAPANPESIRGAKEWLSRHGAMSYRETVDQAALTHLMDLDRARSAPSFDKCYREIQRLLIELASP